LMMVSVNVVVFRGEGEGLFSTYHNLTYSYA
jgi:hypothetical protein